MTTKSAEDELQAKEEWVRAFLMHTPIEIETREELLDYFRRHHPGWQLDEETIAAWAKMRDRWRREYEEGRRENPDLEPLPILFARWREMRKLEEMTK